MRWGTRPEQQTVRATLAHDRRRGARHPVGDRRGRGRRRSTWPGSSGARCSGAGSSSPGPGRRPRRCPARCATRGAEPIEVPVIEIADPADGGAALRVGCRAGSAPTTGSSSRRRTAPSGCWRRCATPGSTRAPSAPPGSRPSARPPPRALAGGGVRADLVPERFVAESLLDAMPAHRAARAGAARPGRGGARRAPRRAARARLGGRRRRRLPHRAGRGHRRAARRHRRAPTSSRSRRRPPSTASSRPSASTRCPPVVACIGPVTAATAREHGLTVDVEADVHTVDGLVDALVAWARR